MSVLWRDSVFARFRDLYTVATRRQRRLVLDLTDRPGPVPFAQLRYVTPRMAEAYAGKTDKTIRRNIKALVKMGLVARLRLGYRARSEIVRAFLPARRVEDDA